MIIHPTVQVRGRLVINQKMPSVQFAPDTGKMDRHVANWLRLQSSVSYPSKDSPQHKVLPRLMAAESQHPEPPL